MADDDGWTMIGKGAGSQGTVPGAVRKKGTKTRKATEPGSPPELAIAPAVRGGRPRGGSTADPDPEPPLAVAVPAPAPPEMMRPAPTPPLAEFRIDSADGRAYSLEEFRLCYGGTMSNPPVEWTTSVAVGYGWGCASCGLLNAPADLGCRECHVARVEPPPPLEKKAGKLEAVLMIPQKSIGSLIGKAGAKIRIIRDSSRCYVHVSEERGERRVVTLTGTAKEIASCREHMRVAIDAVDDSMGSTIKGEIARRKALLTATDNGCRGDPSLVISMQKNAAQPLDTLGAAPAAAPVPMLVAPVPPPTAGGVGNASGHHTPLVTPPPVPQPPERLFPAFSSAAVTAAMAPPASVPPGMAPMAMSTLATPAVLSASTYANTFPKDPEVGQTMFMSTSLDDFYRRAAATCSTDAERALMATEVQVAVVRRGMAMLGHSMNTDEARQMVQSSIEETPVSFQELCDVVKQVAWNTEPVPVLPPGSGSGPPEPADMPQASPSALCRSCGAPGADKTCTGCNSVKYCNVECQRKDWKSGGHKGECGMLRQSRRMPAEELPPQLAHARHPNDATATATSNATPAVGNGNGVGFPEGEAPHSNGVSDDMAHPPNGADRFEITFLAASEFPLGDDIVNGVVGDPSTTTATAAAESVLSSPDLLGAVPWPEMSSLHLGANGTGRLTEPIRTAAFSVSRLPEPAVLPAFVGRDSSAGQLAQWAAQVSGVIDQSFALGVTVWPAALDTVDREIEAAESRHRSQLDDAASASRDAALSAIQTLRQLRNRVDDARRRWTPKWSEVVTRFEAERRSLQMEIGKIESEARSETATVAGLRGALTTANAQAAEFEQRLRDECEVVAGATNARDYEQRLTSLVGMQSILADAVAASKAAVDHHRNLRAATSRAAAKAKQSALLSDEMSLAAAKLNELFGGDVVKAPRPIPSFRDSENAVASLGWGQPDAPKLRGVRADSDDTSDEGAVSDEHDPHSYPLTPASHSRSRFFSGAQPISSPAKNPASRAPPGRLRRGPGGNPHE